MCAIWIPDIIISWTWWKPLNVSLCSAVAIEAEHIICDTRHSSWYQNVKNLNFISWYTLYRTKSDMLLSFCFSVYCPYSEINICLSSLMTADLLLRLVNPYQVRIRLSQQFSSARPRCAKKSCWYGTYYYNHCSQ